MSSILFLHTPKPHLPLGSPCILSPVPCPTRSTQPMRSATQKHHNFQASCTGPHHNFLNELSPNMLPNLSYSSSENLPVHKMTLSLTSVKSLRGSQYLGGEGRRANFSPYSAQAGFWIFLATHLTLPTPFTPFSGLTSPLLRSICLHPEAVHSESNPV